MSAADKAPTVAADSNNNSIENQLKKLNDRLDKYENEIEQQNKKISDLQEQVRTKDKELEKHQNANQDVTFLKNRLKEKEKEIQSLRQEFSKTRGSVFDVQNTVKQIHNQTKTMSEQMFEMDERLTDVENLSPMMGVFEWKLEDYKYHSQNSEYLCSDNFLTHLNGYSCYLSVQWFGSKSGRLGLFVHLNRKKNDHLVEHCRVRMLVQCMGNYGLIKELVVDFDALDSAVKKYRFTDCISCDEYFLVKPHLEKYLIDDCLYVYCKFLPDTDFQERPPLDDD